MASTVEVTRSDHLESRHVVHLAVMRSDGSVFATSGDHRLAAFWRSCAKPFQAIPSVTGGAAAKYGLGDDALALQCASHNGEERHVALARAMLAASGSSEDDLVCGPHSSLNEDVARQMAANGAKPTRAHNNCSGKHAGMIALARRLTGSAKGYAKPDHAVQQHCLAEVARWSGLETGDVPHATDGCGVPSFMLPLEAMALAYARLGAAAEGDKITGIPEDARHAGARAVAAIRKNPFLLAGTARLDTELIEATQGRVIAKVGAEGVYSAMIPDQRLGIALKVEDGATRALSPALLGLLELLVPGAIKGLDQHRNPTIKNTLGDVVGHVTPRITLQRAAAKR